MCVGRCEASKFFRDLAVQNDEELRRKFEGRVSSMTSSPEDTTGVVVQYDEAQDDNVGLVEGELLLESCDEEIEEDEMFMVSYVNTKEVEKAVQKTTHPPTQFTKTTTYNGRPVQVSWRLHGMPSLSLTCLTSPRIMFVNFAKMSFATGST